MNVKSRVVRILKPLRRYRDQSPDSLMTSIAATRVGLQEGEICLGVYENNPGCLEDSIIVTNLGLHIYRSGESLFIDYGQIESIEAPSVKETADRLKIRLSNGAMKDLPIQGGQGRFRDAFEFLRFLDRVKDDIRRQRQSQSTQSK